MTYMHTPWHVHTYTCQCIAWYKLMPWVRKQEPIQALLTVTSTYHVACLLFLLVGQIFFPLHTVHIFLTQSCKSPTALFLTWWWQDHTENHQLCIILLFSAKDCLCSQRSPAFTSTSTSWWYIIKALFFSPYSSKNYWVNFVQKDYFKKPNERDNYTIGKKIWP